MRIGIAYDLKAERSAPEGAPDDALEEYDSPETVAAIEEALRAGGHQPRRLGGGRAFVERLLADPPELVFNIAEGHGSRSREAHVPAVCEALGVACTHADPLTMAASLDKAVAKRLVASFGLPTAGFAVVERVEDLDGLALGWPRFAKPLYEGSSMGIRKRSRAAHPAELRELVEGLLAGYAEPVLVEEFLPGAEFTVGILGEGPGARAIAAMEVVPKQVPVEDFVYSLEVKRNWNWSEEVDYHVPPRRPGALVRAVEEVALGAYRALGCRDVGRVDVRLDRAGAPRFLEANPLPGLAPGWSDLAILWERAGRAYPELVLAIVDEARARLARRARPRAAAAGAAR